MSHPLVDPLAPLTPRGQSALDADSSAASDATPHPLGVGATQRLSQQRLAELAQRLSHRDRQIVAALGELRQLRGDQVRRLFFSEITTEGARARICRRSLQMLVDAKLLHRLQRRIGGTRAGSSGWVFALAPAGRRLLAYWQGEGLPSNRGVHEPGLLFVSHTLAVAELYVCLVEAHRAGRLELLSFETEPTRTYVSALGRTVRLKPDALVQIAAGDEELLSFCEIDLGTEGRGALLRKCRAYIDYYRTGREQAEQQTFPRVVWIAPSQVRAAFIAILVAELPPLDRHVFTCTTKEAALAALTADGDVEGERQ
jgi:hypothetical protein